MSTRRAFRPQRRPIYVGCEGLSEVGYVGLINDMVRATDAPIHVIVEELNQGDPLSRVEMAVRRIAHHRRTRIAPVERFVLLDFDQAEREPARAEQATRLAAANDIHIVWQRPCFEAVLLRHIEGRATHRPLTTPLSQEAILKEWPDYRKGLTRADLATRIDLASLMRAANAEPDLAVLLRCLGIIPAE